MQVNENTPTIRVFHAYNKLIYDSRQGQTDPFPNKNINNWQPLLNALVKSINNLIPRK